MGLRFVLAAYFVGGIVVSGAALLVGTAPVFALQIGFWVGGLGAAVIAGLYDSGRYPFDREPDEA